MAQDDDGDRFRVAGLRTPWDLVTDAFAPLAGRPGLVSMLLLLGTGVVVALAGVGVTAAAIERTSTTEYCTGCHVYEGFAAEYRRTVHHVNDSGVRAECGDCHIPYGHWADTLAVKASSGLSSLWAYHVRGVDTPEDFEARRADLARTVWSQYERRGSDFCANCHEPGAWDLEAQSASARGAHRAVLRGDAQCIGCHKGIAHSIPDGVAVNDAGTVHVSGPPVATTAGQPGDRSAPGGDRAPGRSGDADPAAPKDASTEDRRDSGASDLDADGDDEGRGSESRGETPQGDEEDNPGTGANGGATSGADTPDRASDRSAGGRPAAAGAGSEAATRPDFTSCARCHGTFAPGPEALAELDLETFLSRLRDHMDADGVVASLSREQREALHRELRSR